ncbi:MAG: nitrilase-related carbon-nitrogen hydrolase [Caldilinea sp.]|uniref:nitrilase-related carbon-nitrogen hydrolase n=1 Tax=Caldilinea sp. TaxID=2293560 RepID=UPI003095A0D2
MERYTVACVQQRLRLPATIDDYRENLRRFLRAAENKRARLVVFPELGGLMLAPPLLGDFRARLLKRVDRGRRRNASLWQKFVGSLSSGAANLLRADLRLSLADLLDVAAPELWTQYLHLFGELARESAMTIVAPSLYLPDPLDGVIRNLTGVFGPDGALLGVQAKVMLSGEDERYCQPGVNWHVIHTEVGALGVIIGGDALFPEVGRLLAFQGAEALIIVAAASSQVEYNKLRAAALARMQDNQLYTACSFLVGPNPFERRPTTTYVGKSAIFAPQELTPRLNGVLVEMGNAASEGVLTTEWDFAELRALWESSEVRVRSQLTAAQAHQLLAAVHRQLQEPPLLEAKQQAPPNPPAEHNAPTQRPPELSLDDLPVIASVTSRWPLPHTAPDSLHPAQEQVSWTIVGPPAPAPPRPVRYDEETDEMDALDDQEPRPQ